jgi:nucleotide-binding universal stress UspA family protein
MRTILFPTDFSDNSLNAIKYGLHIAKATKADVLFLHVNHVPMIAPNTPVGVYDTLIRENEHKQQKNLEDLRDRAYRESEISPDEVQSECLIKLGFAVDEISEMPIKYNIGLIVMGTHGASGLKKALIGSNTASVIKKATCPVLSIPTSCTFEDIDKIVLATDFNHHTDDKVFAPLLELSVLFGAEVLIFNVRKHLEEVPSFKEANEGLKVEEALKIVNHSYHFSENDDIAEGIKKFVEEQQPDLLAMLPHRHTFFENLFSKSYTEEMALSIEIPLLTLPEIKEE